MKKRGEVQAIKNYVSAANYLTATQIYLQSNYLLEKPLNSSDIKPTLLGHWGTCPGINFVYAHLNYLIKKHRLSMMFVLGPGHGYPALQANLFMEGTLGKYYPKAKQTLDGIGYISKQFSWPSGFPSHSNPGTPGVILEGGELGYALSTSYGAVLDNPDLIVACLVGDGEAETGPTATAWHLNKFVNPKKDGVVLPILHVNGYKISGPTIFGRMSDKELKSLFYGYGYKPFIVSGKNKYKKMMSVLEKSHSIIKSLKSRRLKSPPRWPMIILRTPKGWTGIKELNNKKVEGNYLSHQVVGKDAKTNPVELVALEEWFRSYKFEELFDKRKGFCEDIKKIRPKPGFCMGANKHAFAGENYKALKLPSVGKYSHKMIAPGRNSMENMTRAGEYLAEVFKLNSNNKNFRLFSPDETYSNRLDPVFEETKRVFTWPIEDWDEDLSKDGRVVEMLSEHSLQGLAQGYTLTGRHGMFTSYEAFIDIVSSMADQYGKFLNWAKKYSWRKNIPSFNYILTSSGWRQEHNGFSHQNPSFISSVLEKSGHHTKVYFPADVNSTLLVFEKCLKSKGGINVIVGGKRPEPVWTSLKEARRGVENGIMTYGFASDSKPDIVFVGVGTYLVKEAMAALKLIKQELPKVRIRFVNVVEVSSLGIGNQECRLDLADYFTKDKPVIFNYHGYPSDLNSLLLKQDNPERFFVHGYTEHGSTTTPFDMQVLNGTSRYQLVIEAVGELVKRKVVSKKDGLRLVRFCNKTLKDHGTYIRKNGVDPEDVANWRWE